MHIHFLHLLVRLVLLMFTVFIKCSFVAFRVLIFSVNILFVSAGCLMVMVMCVC